MFILSVLIEFLCQKCTVKEDDDRNGLRYVSQTKKSLEKVLTRGGIKWYTTKAVAKSGDKAITKASAKAKKLLKNFQKVLDKRKTT